MPRSIFYSLITTIFIITLAVIYVLKKAFTKEALVAMLTLNKKYFFLAFLCMLLYHTFDNLRLFVLSKAVGLRYNFMYGYIISFINTFGATITPAHVGGEFISIYTLARKGGKLHKVLGIVTMKTLTGLAFFIIAFPFMLYNAYQKPKQAIEVFILLLIFFLGFGFFYALFKILLKKEKSNSPFWIRVKYTIKRYIIITKIFLRYKKTYITLATIASICLYLSFIFVAVFLLSAFGAQANFGDAFFSQLLLIYAIFVSPTPGGSGIGEIGGLSVFEAFLEPYLVGIFVIVWRFISQYLSAAIGGILLLLLVFIDTKNYRN